MPTSEPTHGSASSCTATNDPSSPPIPLTRTRCPFTTARLPPGSSGGQYRMALVQAWAGMTGQAGSMANCTCTSADSSITPPLVATSASAALAAIIARAWGWNGAGPGWGPMGCSLISSTSPSR